MMSQIRRVGRRSSLYLSLRSCCSSSTTRSMLPRHALASWDQPTAMRPRCLACIAAAPACAQAPVSAGTCCSSVQAGSMHNDHQLFPVDTGTMNEQTSVDKFIRSGWVQLLHIMALYGLNDWPLNYCSCNLLADIWAAVFKSIRAGRNVDKWAMRFPWDKRFTSCK